MGKFSQIAVLAGGIIAVNALATAAIKLNKKSDTGRAYIMPEDFTVTAHTGSMNTEANSIHCLVAGIEAGADIIEFDINADENGHPVLSHDAPVGGEPLLEDAFRIMTVYKNVRANLDIKNPHILDKVQAIAEEFGLLDRVFFTGIGEESVKYAKEDAPKIKYFLNYSVNPAFNNSQYYCDELVGFVKKYGALGLNIHFSGASKLLADTLHANSLQLSVWTLKHDKDIRNMLDMGVDNITSLRPDKVLKIKKGN